VCDACFHQSTLISPPRPGCSSFVLHNQVAASFHVKAGLEHSSITHLAPNRLVATSMIESRQCICNKAGLFVPNITLFFLRLVIPLASVLKDVRAPAPPRHFLHGLDGSSPCILEETKQRVLVSKSERRTGTKCTKSSFFLILKRWKKSRGGGGGNSHVGLPLFLAVFLACHTGGFFFGEFGSYTSVTTTKVFS
jgi:hypothetical protein